MNLYNKSMYTYSKRWYEKWITTVSLIRIQFITHDVGYMQFEVNVVLIFVFVMYLVGVV